MSAERFVCAAVYRGKVYEMFTISYDTGTSTYAEIMTRIAEGFKGTAVNFEFEAMMEGFEDDGQDTPGG